VQLLLNLGVEGTGLHGDDLGRRIRVVRNRGATLGAEDAIDVLARAASTLPRLDGSVDGHLVLGDDADKRYQNAGQLQLELDHAPTSLGVRAMENRLQ
jgi:hypothetical protein